MKEQSSDLMGLRAALSRAGLALFAFAVLTAWPLLAEHEFGPSDGGKVAAAPSPADSLGERGRSC